MSDLATLLAAARMQFVSLDRMANGRWEATYRGANRNDMRQVQCDDPVAALTAVLTAQPPQAAKPKPPINPHAALMRKNVSDLL